MALSILLGTVGLFTLKPPFTITQVNYQITKLNLISSLVENGIDVFTTFYLPAGLTKDEFNLDSANGHAIVTLESEYGPTINVPDTYISLSPIQPAVPYHHLVLSIDLGDLPDIINLDQLESDVQVMAQQFTGINTKTMLHSLPASKVYSYTDYESSEAIRQAAIADYISFYTGKVSADAELAIAKNALDRYNAIIINQKQQIDTLTAQLAGH